MNRIACMSLASLALAAPTVAGPLDPPGGPVAPTHKTLTEIEPRIAVNAENTPGDIDSLFKIIQPGSYYLTGNITGVAGAHGIEIAASGVTLDLMGFELRGVANSLDGVHVSLIVENVHIRDGALCDWGGSGVNASSAANSSLRDLLAADNGENGVIVGGGSLVDGCAALRNDADGVVADIGSTISRSTATSNGIVGINAGAGASATATNVTSIGNGGVGIAAGQGSTITNATARSNGSVGISAGGNTTIIGAAVMFNQVAGIFAGPDTTISDVTAYGNSGSGVISGADTSISDVTASQNTGIGIDAGAGSQVIDCIASQNDVNGIQLADDAEAVNCLSRDNMFDGVHCFAGATVDRCTVAGNLRDGVRATSDRVSIRDCKADSNGVIGINVSGDGCFVTGNYSTNHPTNYSLLGTSLFGPIHTFATMASNTNPSANYEGL